MKSRLNKPSAGFNGNKVLFALGRIVESRKRGKIEIWLRLKNNQQSKSIIYIYWRTKLIF